MVVNTKIFGEIDIDDSKIVTFENGIIGFPELKHFAVVYDEEKKGANRISYLQSIEEGQFALPVMNPMLVKEDYNPFVDDELLKPLGNLNGENICVLVTVKVPSNIEQISVNLKAPVIINVDEKKGAQVIIEDEYPVRFPIYDILKKNKEKGGE
ncbi:MAG: flagellar assembly protein FliW [Lachnospiraceae bacterium]|nr:flagellar assembly protein FliW [Lachnospiraceae bacterium]MBO4461890.1 flagellar assembly protein FliW [Lachnospiraceae bacterium]MBR4795881.1 flagellar assembly protein FliW [Lachnospiraceae bacterium]MBR5789156.1 flagellar assembly protein FliW [Lachnospiraceae bacterium]